MSRSQVSSAGGAIFGMEQDDLCEPGVFRSLTLSRRGRPRKHTRKAKQIKAEERRELPSDVLLRQLIENPEYLISPISEQRVASELDVPRSSARDAVNELVRHGCLARKKEGICRESLLNLDRLVTLFAMRFEIEWTAIFRILQRPFSWRESLVGRLIPILNQQQSSIGGRFIDWWLAGVHFHALIAKGAELYDWANILHSVMLQIRIGSSMRPEDNDEQLNATEKHWRLLEMIRGESDYDIAMEILQEHVRGSMWRALEACRARPKSDHILRVADLETLVLRLWDEVIELLNKRPAIAWAKQNDLPMGNRSAIVSRESVVLEEEGSISNYAGTEATSI